jgi:hypothetical protein
LNGLPEIRFQKGLKISKPDELDSALMPFQSRKLSQKVWKTGMMKRTSMIRVIGSRRESRSDPLLAVHSSACRLLERRLGSFQEPSPALLINSLALGFALIASVIFLPRFQAQLPMKMPERVAMNTSLAAVL